MANKEPGYVYILTNPSFREDWIKIGMSSRPVPERLRELDNTSIPLPFEIYATLKTVKFVVAEKHVHRMIDKLTSLRIRKNREFFNIHPTIALDIFKDVAEMLDDAVIEIYKEGDVIDRLSFEENPSLTTESRPKSELSIVEEEEDVQIQSDVPQPSQIIVSDFYFIKSKGRFCDAKGIYNSLNGHMTVVAGSVLSHGEVASFKGAELRRKMLAETTEDTEGGYVLKYDKDFDSVSAASNFVMGRSSNGWVEWKDEKGNTLESIEKNKV